MDGSSAPDTKCARLESAHAGKPFTVLYPGEESSFAYVASTRLFSGCKEAALTGVDGFAGIFEKVASKEALYGVVPIENSSSGTIHATYDLLLQSENIVIGGELGVRENYCLCARPGTERKGIGHVLGHPAIIEACSRFLNTQLNANISKIPANSSSDAAAQVSESVVDTTTDANAASAGSKGIKIRKTVSEHTFEGQPAAIASRQAATKYGLTVIADDIGNDHFLESRYVLIHRRCTTPSEHPSNFPWDGLLSQQKKRSGVFALKNEPGALFKLLSCFALREISVLKVESRILDAGSHAPPGMPQEMVALWNYLFYLDYEVSPTATDESNTRLWNALQDFSSWQRDFGIYPTVHVSKGEKKPKLGWSHEVDMMTKG